MDSSRVSGPRCKFDAFRKHWSRNLRRQFQFRAVDGQAIGQALMQAPPDSLDEHVIPHIVNEISLRPKNSGHCLRQLLCERHIALRIVPLLLCGRLHKLVPKGPLKTHAQDHLRKELDVGIASHPSQSLLRLQIRCEMVLGGLRSLACRRQGFLILLQQFQIGKQRTHEGRHLPIESQKLEEHRFEVLFDRSFAYAKSKAV